MALFGIDVKDLGSAVEAVGSVAKDIRAAITGKSVIDPQAVAQIELGIQQLESAQLQAQTSINAIEAASPSLFIAGWRPFIGWVCGVAVAYSFVVTPLLEGVIRIAIKDFTMPRIVIDQLIALVVTMLGMGTLRTVEKSKNAEGNR